MSRQERLEQLLRTAFPNAIFQLLDDSVEHAGHAHGHNGRASALRDSRDEVDIRSTAETHYRLHITDESFRGLPAIQIHRKILAAIKPETDAGMHSFVIERATAP
jgi:stress-induced morphogen